MDEREKIEWKEKIEERIIWKDFGYRFVFENKELNEIDIQKLKKYSVVNYEHGAGGEDGYYANGDNLVALDWTNAYLNEKYLLLSYKVGYTAEFGIGDCEKFGPFKDEIPLNSSSVIIAGRKKRELKGNSLEYTLIDLENGSIERLDMRDYHNKEGLIITAKKENQLTEKEKDLYDKMKEIEEKATERYHAIKKVEHENRRNPIRFLFNKILKKENIPVLPEQESTLSIEEMKNAINKAETALAKEDFISRINNNGEYGDNNGEIEQGINKEHEKSEELEGDER